MRVLILGGTGAMGVELVNILRQKGYDVFVTSRQTRENKYANVRYLKGNAHDIEFLRKILKEGYDVIVDFMTYRSEEFRMRADLLRSSAKYYIFLSSSRVYAPSEKPLTERSPRLLETCTKGAYLRTDDYPLAKARQEDILTKQTDASMGAYTIVRPYITYNRERLQLGIYEKELWLYRAMKGQTVVFPRKVAQSRTTLTYGREVAAYIAELLGNEKAYGQIVQIAMERAVSWMEILEIYRQTFEQATKQKLKIQWTDNLDELAWISGKYAQIFADRMTERSFEEEKLHAICSKPVEFTDPEKGLNECLREFLKDPVFREIPWRVNAWMDRKSGEKTHLKGIPSLRGKIEYMSVRYGPLPAIRMAFWMIRKIRGR